MWNSSVVDVVTNTRPANVEKDCAVDEVGNQAQPYHWLLVSYQAALNFGAVMGFWLLFTGQAKLATFIFSVILFLVSGLSFSIGTHRLWAHQCYKATFGLRMFLALSYTMCAQGSIWRWAAFHRLHHKHSDTPRDPQNPARGIFYAHIGWLMVDHSKLFHHEIKSIPLNDLQADSIVMWQDRNYDVLLLLFGMVLPASIPYFMFGETFVAAWFICVCGHIATLQNVASLTNSVSHHYGYKPYDKSIEATDYWLVSLFTFGEGSHNYHHAFPWDYRTSEYGGSITFSLSTQLINLLAKLGLAYDLKTATPAVITARAKRTEAQIGDSLFYF